MNKAVVVDSDAIFAIYNPNDPLNIRAIKTFQELINQGFRLIYPTPVIFEVISLFQRVLPKPTVTAKIIGLIKADRISVYVADEEILKESAGLFDPRGSKKNTLIDCSVAVIARKLRADGVFSYDSFYARQGLKFASDLLQ